MKREGYGPARADLLAADGRYAPGELWNVDPNAINERLRMGIYRRGGRPGTGWLYSSVHAEYDLNAGLFDLHHHVQAAGSCLTAIDKLRDARRYQHPRAIKITRRPLTDLPRPLTYLKQPFPPARDRSIDKPRRERIPEPAHSLMLLWLDRWGVQSMELMIGLRVVGGRLVAR